MVISITKKGLPSPENFTARWKFTNPYKKLSTNVWAESISFCLYGTSWVYKWSPASHAKTFRLWQNICVFRKMWAESLRAWELPNKHFDPAKIAYLVTIRNVCEYKFRFFCSKKSILGVGWFSKCIKNSSDRRTVVIGLSIGVFFEFAGP